MQEDAIVGSDRQPVNFKYRHADLLFAKLRDLIQMFAEDIVVLSDHSPGHGRMSAEKEESVCS